MLNDLYIKYPFQINLIGLIIGVVLLILSALGIFLSDLEFVKNNEFLQSLYDGLGNYIFWLFIGMLGLTIACGWMFGDLVMKLQKFNKLMNTTSKATFVRNQNDIEELGWKLGPKYMDLVSERKRKFRIRN